MKLAVAVASGKGGVGKTTLSANLGAAIAQMGRDVVVVDMDVEMPNLGFYFGLEDAEPSVHHVLAGEATLSEAVHDTPYGVRVVPGSVSLEVLKKVTLEGLDDLVEEAKGLAELVIVDAAAGLGRAVVSSLASSDFSLLVTVPELTAISDLLRIQVASRKLDTRILGTVLNRVEPGNANPISQEVESILDTRVLAQIPEDPEIENSVVKGELVVVRAPESPGAAALKKLAEDLVGV